MQKHGLEQDSPELDLSLLNELPEVLDALNQATRQFNEVAREQKERMLHQSSGFHQVAVTSEEISAASRSISENSETAQISFEQGLVSCKRGRETLGRASGHMRTMGALVESLAEDIRAMGGRNRRISGIAGIINEITSQLDLLALNAQIEAAGAGENGLRFMAVASEVKSLAEKSSASSRGIQKIIEEILHDVSRLVSSARGSLEAMRVCLEGLEAVSRDIDFINERIEETHALAEEVRISSRQQTEAQVELASTLAEVDASARQNAQSVSMHVDQAVTKLSDLAQYLTLILETTVLDGIESQ